MIPVEAGARVAGRVTAGDGGDSVLQLPIVATP
jgi:hypothetical protein